VHHVGFTILIYYDARPKKITFIINIPDKFFLELEVFQTEVVEEIKTRIFFVQ
jgi:hypothetical protein